MSKGIKEITNHSFLGQSLDGEVFFFGSCVLGLLGHVWHRFRVVPSFVLRSGYSEIGLCRDYIIQILFDNIILNYSVANMLSRTCLVTL